MTLIPGMITSAPSNLDVGSPSQVLKPLSGPPAADQYATQAAQFLADLGSAAGSLVPPTVTVGEVASPASPQYLASDAPALDSISWSLPGFPAAFSPSLDVSGLLPEAFDADAPSLAFPAAPEQNFGEIPDAPAVRTALEDPELEVNLPAPPPLLSLNVRQFEGVEIPAIEPEVPEFTVTAPSVREYEPGSSYTSTLLEALQGELLDRIQNGGTGLNPDVENAIWDRAREREYRQAADAITELERMESMGFNMPPGVYMDARVKVQTELSKNNAGHSREVMIKQAELELEGVDRALQVAQTAEATAIQYANQVEQRAFDSVRYATESGIAIYNAKVQAYGAYVDAYRAKVAVYEAQVQAELAKVEAYRSEVAAEQAKAQINQARVDQFNVLTRAALSAVEVYQAEIAGIQTKADIERLKIQTFGEQVRAYASKINAYTASVEGFRAAVAAEGSKQEAYRSSVAAYGARVDAGAKAIDARIAEYSGRLQAKELEYQGYTARAQTESERIRALAAKNDAVARMYTAEASANNGFNEVLSRQWEAQSQLAINSANVALEEAKANAELYVSTRSLIADTAKVGATVSAQLGAAAISANNYSTSFSTSRSVSGSLNRSQSYSESRSDARALSSSDAESRSVSDQYIYSSSV